MKLTRFPKLWNAVQSLDTRFFERKIAELELQLIEQHQHWDPEHTALTEEGIFYINPESGMATKVVLFEADHVVPDEARGTFDGAYEDPNAIDRLHPYHLVKCNALTSAETQRRVDGYRLSQRLDGKFHLRFVGENLDAEGVAVVYQELERQKLHMCRNCHLKVTSLLEGVRGLARENFPLEVFFNIDFFRSWSRFEHYAPEDPALAHMYPKDWGLIVEMRKRQAHYHCEACGEDYSRRPKRGTLRVHPIEHHKKKISYVRLRCLCPACHDDAAGRSRSEKIARPSESTI